MFLFDPGPFRAQKWFYLLVFNEGVLLEKYNPNVEVSARCLEIYSKVLNVWIEDIKNIKPHAKCLNGGYKKYIAKC